MPLTQTGQQTCELALRAISLSTFPVMKWFIWAWLVIAPSYASISRNWGLDTVLWIPAVLAVAGLVLAFVFPQGIGPIALSAIAGGVLGLLVGVMVGMFQGYWLGCLFAILMVVSGTCVAYWCRRVSGLPLVNT